MHRRGKGKYILLLLLLQLSLEQYGQKLKADSLLRLAAHDVQDSSREEHLLLYAELVENTIPDSAISALQRALGLAEKNSDTLRIMRAHQLLSYCYMDVNNYEKAMEQNGMLLSYARIKKNKKWTGNALATAGNIYQQLGQYDKALGCLLDALKIREASGNTRLTATSLTNIGNFYLRRGELKRGIDYITRAITIQEKNGDRNGVCISTANLGTAYLSLRDFDNAARCFERARVMSVENGNRALEGRILCNTGTLYKNTGQHARALDYFKKSIPIFEQVKSKSGLAAAYGQIGETYLEENKAAQAIPWVQRALLLAAEAGNIEQQFAFHYNLYTLYKYRGDYGKALGHYDQFIRLRDSTRNESKQKEIARNELKYQFEKKAAADSIRNAGMKRLKDAELERQTAQLKQERAQSWFLGGVLLMVAGGLLFAINRFRITRKQKRTIEEQKQQVDEAFEKLEEKNKEVLDSIHYARRIQRALITSEKQVARMLSRLRRS